MLAKERLTTTLSELAHARNGARELGVMDHTVVIGIGRPRQDFRSRRRCGGAHN
jgi:hypothetical protein